MAVIDNSWYFDLPLCACDDFTMVIPRCPWPTLEGGKKHPASALTFSKFFEKISMVDKDAFDSFLSSIYPPTLSQKVQEIVLAAHADIVRSKRLLQNGM